MKVEHRQIVERVRPARRVLVVDDHANLRSRARALLESEGFDGAGVVLAEMDRDRDALARLYG
jgi:CheY-like chemotaxis protein